MWDFTGRKAIVTGGASGIGRTVAEMLQQAGAEVHIFDLTIGDADTLPGIFHQVNIGDPASVQAAVDELADDVTLLVNNAGITRDKSIAKMSDDEWSSVININLGGAFYLIRALAPRMREQGYGRIVNITSINGMRGKFGQANYSAAKAGMIGLTKTAARELGSKGVTVNAVAPGMVLTEMAKKLPEEYLQKALDETVLKELATPEDIANAVLFLLSDAARMITGEIIKVDSGQYI
ncbi:3-oxoacyl-ACP reductase FabG [Sedimenticola selenatireducens]|uniref:SDR family oxidoreductase n=1 Tax=Sedimenticola selenatireducens TaxID=191960 RepID=A0A558DY34_9GAMM|nr:3-oxoacyl-ACP reductase FabG [Sedimenticola selenatireducens]TVO70942.1 SDR family oxidoreductase [Sedimenticola selenatireducens]TVT65808.1 MAG: SDR family oxidoreductase [Sedimenticola selenatireducens]